MVATRTPLANCFVAVGLAVHVLSCAGQEQASATAAGGGDQPRCIAGTRFEQRVEACVADAPDDEGPEVWCSEMTPRPTREIMSEVQDLEQRRVALARDDPRQAELTLRLAKGYEELGCATFA